MKPGRFLGAGLALALVGASLPAQQTDYLTPAEVEKVRDTQEPNQRLNLFLEFAQQRLVTFEKALARTPGQEPTHPDVLRDLLNNFINAIDDAASTLDWALERGGVDLRKGRKQVEELGKDFIARLQHIQETYGVVQREFPYDLEDALIATRDLMELEKKIPDEPIPPRLPSVLAGSSDEKAVPAGRPTLKRRKEKEKKKDDKPN